MRKNSSLPKSEEKKKGPKSKKEMASFDEEYAQELLTKISGKETENKLVYRHFLYISLYRYYYKYRNVDKKYLKARIKYCKKDINSLHKMAQQFIKEEIETAKVCIEYEGTAALRKEKGRIRNEGFIGNIPAFDHLRVHL
jgi:hypothetical protein